MAPDAARAAEDAGTAGVAQVVDPIQVPQQDASAPAVSTHVAPRVSVTFDDARPVNQASAPTATPEDPSETASTTRRAATDSELRTHTAEQPAASTADVPTWSSRKRIGRDAEPQGAPRQDAASLDAIAPASVESRPDDSSPAKRDSDVTAAQPAPAAVTAATPTTTPEAVAPPTKSADAPSIFTPPVAKIEAEPVAPAANPAAVAAVPAPVPAVTAEVPAIVPVEPAPAQAATAPAAPPAMIVATNDPIAAALQAKLPELIAALPRRLAKSEREALATYYVGAQFHPVWVANGHWTAGAQTIMARLKDAEADGLDPADYPLPVLGLGGASAHIDNPNELAEAEFKLSAAALLYARDARGGRIEPTRLSALITPKLELPGAEALMARLAPAADPGAVLESYNPTYPGYIALKAKLADLRANRPTGPMVRLRRAVPGSTKIASLDGAVPPPRMEGDIIANMERWRWLPAEVGPRYILVNIPQFKLDLIEDGRSVHEARVIVGKPEAPTPVFSGEIEYAVVNPSWYIPPSIMKKEILPGLAADPSYAARRGFEVIRHGNQISVRQPPGERNALGFIKFMFPNQHSVYLHDTPNRNLFSASMRAFSHGCVRVDQPFALADFVLGREWPEARLKKMIGRGERTIRMATKLPVNLAYFTLTVDGSGDVKTFGDLYGINRKVRLALGLGA